MTGGAWVTYKKRALFRPGRGVFAPVGTAALDVRVDGPPESAFVSDS
ncbi:hypothetical protein [Halalkaliarchaeum desulfuricum]|nr:hypothetical protein [Halalkaliarchaeum desulfuricum]